MMNKSLFALVAGIFGSAIAQESGQDCTQIATVGETKLKAKFSSCSGWALKRWPEVRDWMTQSAPKYDYKDITIDKSGGDPRMQLFEIFNRQCMDVGREGETW